MQDQFIIISAAAVFPLRAEGVDFAYRVCCFPIQDKLVGSGLYPGVVLSPDAFNEDVGVAAHPTVNDLLKLALRPYGDEMMTDLIATGRLHAEMWIRKSIQGSIWSPVAPDIASSIHEDAERRENALIM